MIILDIDEVIFTAKDQMLCPNYCQYRDKFEEELIRSFDKTELENLRSTT